MDTLAHSLLSKLLSAAEMCNAGRRSRQAALTESTLAEYRGFSSLPKKESFEETMRAARAEGAVELVWDGKKSGEGFIKRINLVDRRNLAAFLGIRLSDDKVDEAREHLQPFVADYPVLEEVIDRWKKLRKVRSLGPEKYQDWMDAIRTIVACQNAPSTQTMSLPVRKFSSQLFKDSKRIEKLIAPLDVLLVGGLDGDIRPESGVLQELGLFREEHPARLAGNVIIERERVTACLDQPYSGLPAQTVLRLASTPSMVMTIENLTTFHSEARQRCDENVLLIYTAGMPSPAWRAMYRRLLGSLSNDVPLYHWGDVDEGGFRIAATLASDANSAGYKLLPWKMHPDDVPKNVRRKATQHTLAQIRHFSAVAGWSELGDAISEAEFVVEQESL
ncbi:Wadjet anti-phage system protein JetD domain-containing protein [Methylophilus sp. TWE2]|uniref:Wadjet anti-phage system protein JetD domain-containing protein n=1 Tax=Methylophilus sp. TWE2 TaxID=1662285 RepID=UPI00067117BD|nr:Wadjet anti-phage system protein JetD domain-containing protein [Methylophilus sp. TWE2]AKR42206.1 hypothetical protein ACJ67_01235 [Methylophilus sp. TWE2]